MRPERIFAGYLALQAASGIAFWILLSTSEPVRSALELAPARSEVMDAFIFADAVAVIGSVLGAWAIESKSSWTVPIVAFTAGAMVYPTMYLVGWVAFTGVGALCLAVMVPPSILTCWISYQIWRSERSAG